MVDFSGDERAEPSLVEPLVVTEAEAAALLRLSRRTLQRLRVIGGGPPYVELMPGGSRIGYPMADLRTWLAARRTTSTSAATVSRRESST